MCAFHCAKYPYVMRLEIAVLKMTGYSEYGAHYDPQINIKRLNWQSTILTLQAYYLRLNFSVNRVFRPFGIIFYNINIFALLMLC